MYRGTGRRGWYCSNTCRQRAWALRTAGEQLAAGQDPRPRVVREVVERVTERVQVRPVPIPGVTPPAPATSAVPTDARGWAALLGQLEQQLLDERSPIAGAHWNHRRVFEALVRASTALGRAHPGGLDQLSSH